MSRTKGSKNKVKEIVDAQTYNGGPGEEGKPIIDGSALVEEHNEIEVKPKRIRKPKAVVSLDSIVAEFKAKRDKMDATYQKKKDKLTSKYNKIIFKLMGK